MIAFRIRIRIFLLFLFVTTIFLIGCSPQNSGEILEKELAYLKNISEVGWVEIEKNNVYIGFKKRPPDLMAILRAAALIGNKALDFQVHVWAVDAKRTGWRPGSAPHYAEVTAKYGKIQD